MIVTSFHTCYALQTLSTPSIVLVVHVFGGVGRGAAGGLVVAVFVGVVAGGFGDRVAAGQPLAEVDIGAAFRAERPVGVLGAALADRAAALFRGFHYGGALRHAVNVRFGD
jgi:hypothetical protein